MDINELKDYLKENLGVVVRTDKDEKGFFTEVSLYLGDEIISSDHEWTNIFEKRFTAKDMREAFAKGAAWECFEKIEHASKMFLHEAEDAAIEWWPD